MTERKSDIELNFRRGLRRANQNDKPFAACSTDPCKMSNTIRKLFCSETTPRPADAPTKQTSSGAAGSSRGNHAGFQANPLIKRRAELHTDNDPYAFLRKFDTVFLIDDSGSLWGRSWRETREALTRLLEYEDPVSSRRQQHTMPWGLYDPTHPAKETTDARIGQSPRLGKPGTTNLRHRNISIESSFTKAHEIPFSIKCQEDFSLFQADAFHSPEDLCTTDVRKHYEHMFNPGTLISQDLSYSSRFKRYLRLKQHEASSYVSDLTQLLLRGLSYAQSNAMRSILGVLLMTPLVGASPTGNRDSTFQHQDTGTSLHKPQWPWHLAVGISTSACLGLSWIFNRRREVGIRDYETWFLIAALLHNVEYGYKAFVEEKLDSSWSAGLAAISFTALWTYHDTRRLGTNARQLLALGIAIFVLALDTKLSSSMNPTNFGKSFMALLVPCVMGATLFWRAVRTIGDLIVLLN